MNKIIITTIIIRMKKPFTFECLIAMRLNVPTTILHTSSITISKQILEDFVLKGQNMVFTTSNG